MKTHRESVRDIPVVRETSILVVGGGPAGFAACIAAARQGNTVTLVEKMGFLGGASTGLLVTTWPYRHLLLDDGDRKVYEGIYKEFVARLVQTGGISIAPEEITPWNSYSRDIHGTMIPADPELTKYVYAEMLQESDANVMLHNSTVGVIQDNEIIKGIIVENASGRQAILAERIIDATGDGDVAARAGVPFSQGDNAFGRTQPSTLMFLIGNVNIAQLSEYMVIYADYDLQKILKQGLETDEIVFPEWPEYRDFFTQRGYLRIRVYNSKCRPGEVIVHGAHVVGLDATNERELSQAEFEVRKQMIALYKFLKKRVPGFEQSYITASATKIGVRESRRIHGEHVLTKEEAFEGKNFDDVILRNTSGVLEERNVIFDVPYRCLIPKKVENLLIAGRCVSIASDIVNSMRDIPVCMGTGQVTGTAAVLSIEESVPPRQIDVNILQRLLAEQDVNLGPYRS